MYLVWYLLIGLVEGWLASLMVKERRYALVVNLLTGLIGGFLGGWLVSLFGWIPIGSIGSFLTSILGAMVLLCIVEIIAQEAV
jgi:uncharacterized membrane protein YeaQ/YmgE (transglycosylase-associated protein family)